MTDHATHAALHITTCPSCDTEYRLMADPDGWINRNGVLHKRTLRHRLVVFLLDFGCRHPAGIVCDHRHFEYDARLRGYHEGYAAGDLQERGAEGHQ